MQLCMKLLDEEEKINKLPLGEAEVASVWLLVQNVLKSHCECDLCILIGSPVTQKLYIGKLLTAENKWKKKYCDSLLLLRIWSNSAHAMDYQVSQ